MNIMKQLLIFTFIVLSLTCRAQDSTKVDSSKRYAIILSQKELDGLMNIIASADLKPSDIKQVLFDLKLRTVLLGTTLIPDPKKQKK